MWSWFGGSAAQKRKDAPKDAILKLREQLDMLQKREKHLENLMEEQDAVARKNVTTNKNGMGVPFFPLSLYFVSPLPESTRLISSSGQICPAT